VKVKIVSVGTEILLGNIVNTNAAYLAKQCANLGLSCYEQITVGDNEERLQETIQQGLETADIIILTGGLGPTKDDITKEVAAKVMKYPLKLDEESKENIINYFNLIGKPITENNWKQAMLPEPSHILKNENGTAPGVIMEKNGKYVVLLPGPPEELSVMFEKQVIPFFKSISEEIIYSHMVKICGHGESKVDEEITDLLENQTNPTIAPYAKSGEVHLRVTSKAKNEEEAETLMQPMLLKLKERFGDSIYTMEEHITLEESIVTLIKKNKLSISTVESCTGGLLAARLINVSGVSSVYQLGHITYSEEAKIKAVGVKKETIDTFGVVSEEVAKEMAIGEAKFSNTKIAVSVTGLAGPNGGTKEKPVGLVYIACYICGNVYVKRFIFPGNRIKIRNNAVSSALVFLREKLLQYSK